MILSINHPTNTIITISSTLLDNFIASPSSYTKIEITGKINCTGAVTKTYSSTSLITGSTDVRTSAGVETIVPNFFSTTAFANGVYGFEVALTSLSGNTTKDAGCLFVDEGSIFCAIDKNDSTKLEYYYALEKGQNCSCNCTNLCDILTAIQDSTTNDCNC